MKKKVLAVTLATVLAVSLGLVMAGPVGADINGDLQGYWRLDTDVNDYSGNGNGGTLVNGAATTGESAPVPGDGGSLSVDGINDYVSIPDHSSLDITGGTWAAWVNFDRTPWDAGHHMNPVAKAQQYWIHASNGTGSADIPRTDAIQVKVNVGGTRYTATTAADFIQVDTWYHVAGTYDSDTLRLYVNGYLVDSNTDPSGPIQDTSNILAIGTWSMPTDYFEGLADEVRVYNRVLTEQEIGMLAGEGSITLSPEEAFNPVNTGHTVTAEADVNGSDITEPYTVNFEVTSGPNSGDSAEVDTDATGNIDDADFSYNGDGGDGIDQINAWIDIDLDDEIDSGEPQATAEKYWFISVSVDIKPTSCPNPLNLKSKGVLPVAVLGTGDFDVAEIDPETVELAFFGPGSDPFDGGVPAERSASEDVATPYEEVVEGCDDCSEEGPDGLLDLTLKFDKQAVIATLGDVGDGDCILLTLTGYLYDGTGFLGSDVVRIIKKENNANGPPPMAFSNGKGPKNK